MRFSLFFKIFFLTTLMSGCESNTSFNDENLNIYGEDISDIFILEDNLINSLESSYSFIALGDSYTIGEGVNENERWPNQFVNLANENGFDFDQPVIIAETGWKTYDLIWLPQPISIFSSSNFLFVSFSFSSST